MEPLTPASSTRENTVVSALKNLTEGVTSLVRHHLALARFEARADALSLVKDVAALAIAGTLALVGYGMLNLAAVLFAAWFGVVAMALVALALALVNTLGGLLALRALMQEFKQRHYGPHYAKDAIKRSTQWAKQIPETL